MSVNEEIFELFDYIDDHSLDKKDELTNHLEKTDRDWDKLPDSKLEDSDRTLLADTMIDCYFKVNDFSKARKWIDIYLHNEEFEEQISFHNGRLEFEKGNFKKALELFKDAQNASGERMLEGKGKYLDFYLHPEKYIKG